MATVNLSAQKREDLGNSTTKTARKKGIIPGVFYFKDAPSIAISVKDTALNPFVYTSEVRIINLQIEGSEKAQNCILKEIQFDAVTDAIKHLDFQQLVDGKAVKVSLPLHLKGTPKGAATGGKLEQTVKRLNVFATPEHLRAAIELNVEDMDMGGIKRVKDIEVEGLELLHAPAIPVARVSVPRAAKEAAAAEAKKK